MRTIYRPGYNVSAGLLLIRLVTGSICAYGGSTTLLRLYAAPVEVAAKMHSPICLAYALALLYMGGGIAMSTGILFPYGCLGIAVITLRHLYLYWVHEAANLTNHFSFKSLMILSENLFFALAVTIGLAIAGPGGYVLSRGWMSPQHRVPGSPSSALPD